MTFYHRQIGEVAAEENLDVGSGSSTRLAAPRRQRESPAVGLSRPIRTVHAHLADYFGERWSQPETHALLELIPQLAAAGREEEVRSLLLQYRWISCKLAATNVHLLLADYDEVTLDGQEPARLIGGALRLSSHVLAMRPQEMQTQLLGRMLDFEEPEIRGLLDQARAAIGSPALIPVWRRLDPPGGPLLRTVEEHRDTINAIALSADDTILVSGAEDDTVKIWDFAKGTLLRTLTGHQDPVWALAISSDSRTVVSGAGDINRSGHFSHGDNTLRVWDLASGTLLRTLSGHEGGVYAVTLSPDGRIAFSGSQDQTVRVWDLASGRLLRTIGGFRFSVHALALAQQGLLVGGGYGLLQLWDPVSGKLLRTLAGHDGSGVYAVALSDDGATAFSASSDRTVKVWDLSSGALLHTLEGHEDHVQSLALTRDGRTLVSGSNDRTVRIWDVASGKLLRTLEGNQYAINGLVIDRAGQTVVSGGGGGTLKFWDLALRPSRGTLREHQDWITTVATDRSGTTIISGSTDGALRVWDSASGRPMRALVNDGHEVTASAIAEGGRTAVSGSTNGQVKVWEVASGNLLRLLVDDVLAKGVSWPAGPVAEAHRSEIQALAIREASSAIVVSAGGYSGSAEFKTWNLDSGRLLGTQGPPNLVNVTLNRDGRFAMSSYHDRWREDWVLKVWNTDSGELLRDLRGHPNWGPFSPDHLTMAMSGDGRIGISSSRDRAIRVWDLGSGMLLRVIQTEHEVRCAALGEDGRFAVCAGVDDADATITVWDLFSAVPVARFTGDSSFSAVAIVQSSSRVVAGDARRACPLVPFGIARQQFAVGPGGRNSDE